MKRLKLKNKKNKILVLVILLVAFIFVASLIFVNKNEEDIDRKILSSIESFYNNEAGIKNKDFDLTYESFLLNATDFVQSESNLHKCSYLLFYGDLEEGLISFEEKSNLIYDILRIHGYGTVYNTFFTDFKNNVFEIVYTKNNEIDLIFQNTNGNNINDLLNSFFEVLCIKTEDIGTDMFNESNVLAVLKNSETTTSNFAYDGLIMNNISFYEDSYFVDVFRYKYLESDEKIFVEVYIDQFELNTSLEVISLDTSADLELEVESKNQNEIFNLLNSL